MIHPVKHVTVSLYPIYIVSSSIEFLSFNITLCTLCSSSSYPYLTFLILLRHSLKTKNIVSGATIKNMEVLLFVFHVNLQVFWLNIVRITCWNHKIHWIGFLSPRKKPFQLMKFTIFFQFFLKRRISIQLEFSQAHKLCQPQRLQQVVTFYKIFVNFSVSHS
jgi:hypothetical protein